MAVESLREEGKEKKRKEMKENKKK